MSVQKVYYASATLNMYLASKQQNTNFTSGTDKLTNKSSLGRMVELSKKDNN